jgi:[CysO sulfur-carrier protein]-S-L-cysteine hydrolase
MAIAREALPNEACAILSGPNAGLALTVRGAMNAAGSPYRFELDPSDLVRIVHAIEAAGDEIVSIFHSHPASPATPSATDLREARYDVVHLIADMRDPGAAAASAMRGWRIGPDGACSEVDLDVSG